jgi:hypothetical protein
MARVFENIGVSSTATLVFTCPTAEVFTISKLSLTDKKGVNQTAKVYIANDGGAASATNQVGPDITVVADGGGYRSEFAGDGVPAGGKIYVAGSDTSATLEVRLVGFTAAQTRNATTIG